MKLKNKKLISSLASKYVTLDPDNDAFRCGFESALRCLGFSDESWTIELERRFEISGDFIIQKVVDCNHNL